GPEHPEVARALLGLANLYRYYKDDSPRAEPLYRRALDIFEKVLGPEHPEAARALLCLALLYHDQADYARAEPLYRQALGIFEKTLGAEHPEFASALNNLALLFRNQGDYAKATLLIQRALAIREQVLGPEHPEVAASLNSLAILYIERGEYAKAEPLYQRALAIREQALGPAHIHVAYALNNLANLYRDRGEYARAGPLYQRSLAIREQALEPGHRDLAVALINLAVLYWAQGENAKAEPLYQRALTIQENALGPDHPYVAESLNNLANFCRDRGDYAKAEPLYRRALAIREKMLGPEHSSVAESLHNLAILYKDRGEYAKAEPLDQRALAIREKALGPEHPHVAQSLNNLADIYRGQGEDAKAESFYQRALTIQEPGLGPEHPEVAITINNLAILYQKRGEYARAESFYQRALAIQERGLGPEHPEVALTLNNLAALYAVTGAYARAVAFQSRANAISEHHLTLNLACGSERQKLAYLALYSTQTDFTLSLHHQVAPDDQEAINLAFTTLLRRKGRGVDAMIDTIAAMRHYVTPQDQELFDQLVETRSQLAALILKGLGAIKPETYRARLRQLEERVEELEAILSARSAEFNAQTQPAKISAVQAALQPGSLLVEFAVYKPQDLQTGRNRPPRYVAYLLTAGGPPKWIDLGEAAAIERAIADWRRALRDPRRTDVKQLARIVDEKVMRPVRASAHSEADKIRRLLIAPDGLLNLIPFAALVDQRGRYLVEDYSISYLMSGRDLLRLRVSRPGPQDAVVVAAPDYGEIADVGASGSRDVGLPPGPSQSAGSSFNLAQIYFPQLEGTAREAEALKAILPRAAVFTGKQATETTLKRLHRPSILHVATHGFFLHDQGPGPAGTRGPDPAGGSATVLSGLPAALRSGLALAGANLRMTLVDQEDDGVLTALEAAGLDLWGTRLVVLSACDTGVGEVKNGEGVYGLRRALVIAGSETQVISLWPVSDLGTRDLMIEYYKALQRGEGRSEGLRLVQLKLLKRKDRRHPFYWASFIQSGEWANLEGRRE
ncbi:MAG TPA: CHAT domain-containing tetratricopeptide repeat protein, partial [Blastocatellia bacterium]|nr:CHAT domain-containing tetratricopeptide repeat protein [Blastocatellia bacterium]